jgi:hypothetical protein
MVSSKVETWAVRAGVCGVLLFEAGFALTQMQVRGVTIPQWNALCRSGLVQLSQLSSVNAVRDCQLVADADQMAGWLIRAGIALLALSLIAKCGQACLKARLQVQFRQNVPYMTFHRRLADAEFGADLCVREAGPEKREDLALARSERVEPSRID